MLKVISNILHFRHVVTGTLVKNKVIDDENSRINTKKVWVNAQVTGTIAFIEMILTVLYVVMIAYYGSTHFTNLLLVMVLYDIILPYAFLMNTSHNKERIVEFGWKNVLKNIIFRSGSNSVADITKVTDKKTYREFEKESKNKETNSVKVSTILASSKGNLDNNSAVSTMTQSKPSSSKGVDTPEPDFVLLSVNSLPRQRPNDETLLKLVLDLKYFEKNENAHLKCIQRLAKLQESIKAGKTYSREMSEDDLIPHCYKGAKNKCKKSKGKRVRSPKNVAPGNYQGQNLFSNDTEEENHIVSNQTPSLTGDRKVRNSKRKGIIDQINDSTGNEKLCYDLIEKLIDLEESFVSGC